MFCSLASRDHMKSSTVPSFENIFMVSSFTSSSFSVYAPELQVKDTSFVFGL